MNDPFCIFQVDVLINKMADAVEIDISANRDKTPAVAKVKLLPEVISMLQRYAFLLLSKRGKPLVVTCCLQIECAGRFHRSRWPAHAEAVAGALARWLFAQFQHPVQNTPDPPHAHMAG